MRALACVAVLVLVVPATVVAQGRLCLRARPKPDCGAFVLTNAGGYVMFGGGSSDYNGGTNALRGVVDYGVMVNVSARDAFGGSVFASLDRQGFGLGPAVRYRRWLTPTASLEVAVGKPLAGDPELTTGAVFGLVKWSPNHWLALAARPEVRRAFVCGPSTCTYQSRGRVSLGTEIGAVPGLVITGVGAAGFVAFLAILLAGGYGGD